MIDPAQYPAADEWLRGFRRPLLLTHQRPDGDALGSLAGLDAALRQRGADPWVALFDPLPPRYALLRDAARWLAWDDVRDTAARECDAVVVLDTCAFSQLEPAARFLAAAPPTLVVDHHATRDRIGTREGDLRILDESASATSLLVAEWAECAGIPLTGPVATALFVGVATDCGWFRFSNTDARTLAMAARLVHGGADPAALFDAIYQQEQPARLRLTARLLGSLELHANGRLAVMTLRQSDFDAAGADRGMTEDLVNEAVRLATVEMAILFTEEEGPRVRANFRSKGAVDVSALASRYGGGGHARAAGARINGAWEQVVPRVLGEALEMFDGAS